CVFANDLRMQSGQRTLMLLAILAGSGRVLLGDAKNRLKSRSRFGVALVEAPRSAFEFLLGYGFVVPLYWVFIELVSAAFSIHSVVRASRVRRSVDRSKSGSLSALFVRATLTSASEGGMPTHESGFANGSKTLGHRLKFLLSGEKGDKEDTIAFA